MNPAPLSPIPHVCVNTLRGHQGPIFSVRFNITGEYCASAGGDKTVKLWNPHNGKLIQTYKGHGYEVYDVQIADDSKRFASCSGDKQVFIWDVTTGVPLRKLRDHKGKVNCISFNKDCEVLVSASYDRTVKVWDMRSNSFKPIQTMDDFGDSVSSVYVSKEEIVTGCVDGCVRTYDIRTGKLIVDNIGPSVTCVSMTRDEKCICVSTLDDHVRLLDRVTGELLNSYSGHINSQLQVGHCITNDDSYVITGSEDGSIFIYDLMETKIVERLDGHERTICGIAYTPQKSEICLLTASADSTIKVWKQYHV